jgi:hypothetical protein
LAGGVRGRLPSSIYTSDIEKAVVSERPVLIYAQLDDIRTTGDGYTAELSSPVTEWLIHMHYRLFCNAAVAQKLTEGKRSEFRIFAIVAHIDRVEKRTEPDNSYFLADGTAKEVVLVGIRGLAQSRGNAAAREIIAPREFRNA